MDKLINGMKVHHYYTTNKSPSNSCMQSSSVSDLLKSICGLQLVIHGLPTSLTWMQKIPKESRFGIITNLIFLNIVFIHTATRILATYPNATRLEFVLDVIGRWVV